MMQVMRIRLGRPMLPHFEHPERLWALLGVLSAALLVGVGGPVRRLGALGRSGFGPGLRFPWIALAAGLLVLGWAEPGRDEVARTRSQPGRDVVLLLDVSRSMSAGDVWPSRLAAAVRACAGLIDVVARSPQDRVGVVSFAGRARLICPITANLGAVAESLKRLAPGMIEPGGSNLGAGLEAALGLLERTGDARGGRIYLLSDGEDHAPAWRGPVESCVASGVVVHAFGLGDALTGATIPGGRAGTVVTRRRDDDLSAIARATGGTYVPAGTLQLDLALSYRRDRPAARAPMGARLGAFTLTTAASVAALLLLLVGCGRSGRPIPRRLGRLWLLAVLSSVPISMALSGPGDAFERAYFEGRYEDALRLAEVQIAEHADAAAPRFNAAACDFQRGAYVLALMRYTEARERADPELVATIEYAIGNTLAALGRAEEALAHYDACIAAAAEASLREDAAINRAYVAAWLESQARRTERRAGAARARPAASGAPGPTAESSTPEDTGAEEAATEASPERQLERAVRSIAAARPDARGLPPGRVVSSDAVDW